MIYHFRCSLFPKTLSVFSQNIKKECDQYILHMAQQFTLCVNYEPSQTPQGSEEHIAC